MALFKLFKQYCVLTSALNFRALNTLTVRQLMNQASLPRICPIALNVFFLGPLKTTVHELLLRRLMSPLPHQNLRKYGRVTGVVKLAVLTPVALPAPRRSRCWSASKIVFDMNFASELILGMVPHFRPLLAQASSHLLTSSSTYVQNNSVTLQH